MSKLRRFRVDSLQDLAVGDALILPPDELRHARVLRLAADTTVELFDAAGRSASAVLTSAAGELAARIVALNHSAAKPHAHHLSLATAWPRGKRAAVLVEKCSELGLDELIPIQFARSVVTKDDEAEGVARLRRIAAEAAKQSGRNTPLDIAAEVPFARALTEHADALALIAEPRAAENLVDILQAERAKMSADSPRRVIIYIGPEGGFTPEELQLAAQHGMRQIKVARNVLRVETAAIAACSITRAILE